MAIGRREFPSRETSAVDAITDRAVCFSLIVKTDAGRHQSKTSDTNPSARLGSNQADFSGITWPASATAISPLSMRSESPAMPRIPPTNWMLSSRRGSRPLAVFSAWDRFSVQPPDPSPGMTVKNALIAIPIQRNFY